MIAIRSVRLLAPCAALAACGAEPSPEIAALGGEPVECALAGAGQFTPVCRMVRAQGERSVVTVIYHPDGGFRRFKGLSPAMVRDGALEAHARIDGDYLVLGIDGDRYRWPKGKWR